MLIESKQAFIVLHILSKPLQSGCAFCTLLAPSKGRKRESPKGSVHSANNGEIFSLCWRSMSDYFNARETKIVFQFSRDLEKRLIKLTSEKKKSEHYNATYQVLLSN